MGTYILEDTPQVRNFVNYYLKDDKTITDRQLLELVRDLHDHNIYTYISSESTVSEMRYGDKMVFDVFKGHDVSFDVFYEFYSVIRVIRQVMSVLVKMGVTVFDFTESSNTPPSPAGGGYFHIGRFADKGINLNMIIFETSEIVTFKGRFVLPSPVDSDKHKYFKKIRIDGEFSLDNRRSKDIELPEGATLPPFKEYRYSNIINEWESVEAYRQRPDRLNRLAALSRTKALVKSAKETGILTFTDNYGMPLEVGCTVVFSAYSCRLGTVIGQDSKKITVKELFTPNSIKVLPHELVRIR